MTADQALELGRSAILMTLLAGAPVLIVAVAVGLLVSILQAVTQLQDQTLSFVPKIVAMFLTLLYVLPWVLMQMVEYATTLVNDLPYNL